MLTKNAEEAELPRNSFTSDTRGCVKKKKNAFQRSLPVSATMVLAPLFLAQFSAA
jgi:hypothetical protein